MLDIFRTSIRSHALSKNEIRILFAIENSPKPKTITQLSRHLGFSRSTLYRQIERLQQRRLIIRNKMTYTTSKWKFLEKYQREIWQVLHEELQKCPWIQRALTPTHIVTEKPKDIGAYIYDICKNPRVIQILCGNAYIIINTQTEHAAILRDPMIARRIRTQWKCIVFRCSKPLTNLREVPEALSGLGFDATEKD